MPKINIVCQPAMAAIQTCVDSATVSLSASGGDTWRAPGESTTTARSFSVSVSGSATTANQSQS